ncbi:MAG: hypothetical protein AB8B83_04125 [Bdellovibrionales bacterium]
MKYILKTIAFTLTAAIGFGGIIMMFHILQIMGVFDETATIETSQLYFQNAIFTWLAGIIIAIGYWIINNPIKYIFLLSPIIAIVLYGLKLVFVNPLS